MLTVLPVKLDEAPLGNVFRTEHAHHTSGGTRLGHVLANWPVWADVVVAERTHGRSHRGPSSGAKPSRPPRRRLGRREGGAAHWLVALCRQITTSSGGTTLPTSGPRVVIEHQGRSAHAPLTGFLHVRTLPQAVCPTQHRPRPTSLDQSLIQCIYEAQAASGRPSATPNRSPSVLV